MDRLGIALLALASLGTSAAQSTYLVQTLAGSDDVLDGGPALSALFAHIEGVATDAQGNVFIADADGHRIRRITPGGIVSTIAGTGHAGYSGDGGPAITAQLNTPYGVAADSNGNVYIADLGNARVRRISRDGVISTIAGGGTTAPNQSDGRAATSIALNSPRNVAVDSYGNVFFSDFGGHRVFEIITGGIILRVAGTGQAGYSGDGGAALFAQLNSPAGLAVDSSGALYIADSANGRIRKLVRGLITTVGDSSPSISLGTPTGIAIDTDGNLWIADPGAAQVLRVTRLLQVMTVSQPARDAAVDAAGNVYTCSGPYVYRRTRAGAVTIVAGSGAYAYSGDGGPAYKARMNAPSGIARDPAGVLYVADTGNHRIRKITPDGTIYTIAGAGAAGSSGDNGSASTAKLNAPLGVAADLAGNIYVADTGNHIVRRIDPAGIITTIAGTGEHGFSGDNGPGTRARLDTPSAVAVDVNGNVYIADTGNHVIRRVSTAGVIATIVGKVRGFAGDGGDPLSASLDSPRAIALDAHGILYIADSGNRRIRRVSASTAAGSGLISTFPQPDANLWRLPRGVAVDDSGVVFVSDAADQRVFRIEANGRITAIAGDGIQGFNGEAAPGLSARLDTPMNIAVDPAGNLFAADSGNGRIRKLTPMIDLITAPPVDSSITVVNAASLRAGPIAPGEILSLFGTGLTVSDGPPAGTQVTFNGNASTLFFVQQNQINLLVPASLAGVRSAQIKVLVNGTVRGQATVEVVDAAPAIFTMANGTGQAAALNEDGTPNSPDRPAPRGTIVTLFATGNGGESVPVKLRIGDYAAELLYAQAAPGFAGLMQINARVPGGFAPAGLLSVVLQTGSAQSQPGVTLAIQ
jgi:uncharacterized protein (TIGR03437 family)